MTIFRRTDTISTPLILDKSRSLSVTGYIYELAEPQPDRLLDDVARRSVMRHSLYRFKAAYFTPAPWTGLQI